MSWHSDMFLISVRRRTHRFVQHEKSDENLGLRVSGKIFENHSKLSKTCIKWCGAVRVRMRVCAVWYGMVWYGMVWYGMVWRGVAWCVEMRHRHHDHFVRLRNVLKGSHL